MDGSNFGSEPLDRRIHELESSHVGVVLDNGEFARVHPDNGRLPLPLGL